MEATKNAAITDQVTQIIAEQLKIPIDRLSPTTALQELGAESLDFIEIVFTLEETFDISIPYNANEAATDQDDSSPAGAAKFETIGQISEAVKRLVDTKARV